MKIKVISLSDESLEENDFRDSLTIEIDGKIVFSVCDGEPEDANLSRDFSDCWDIVELMKIAHAAGVRNQKFDVEEIKK